MRIVETPDAPAGSSAGRFPYSQAVVAAGLVFVSGQGRAKHPLDVPGLLISMAVIAES